MTGRKMKDRPYKVFRIEEGVVVDHIPAGKSLSVISVLGVADNMGEGIITTGMNLDSTKMGKKDVVKVENKKLTRDELNKISLIAPDASINIISKGAVSEKLKISIPQRFLNLVRCPNPRCVTRNYDMRSLFKTESRNPLSVKCHYCERSFDREDVELL